MKKIFIIILSAASILFSACQKKTITTTEETAKLPAPFSAWANLFDGEGVGAIQGIGDATILFNKAGTKYAWFENEEIKGVRNIKDPNSPFRDIPLETIGAIGLVKKYVTNSNAIVVFNKEGTEYFALTSKNGDAEGLFNDRDLFTISQVVYTPYDFSVDGSCPFNAISALYQYDLIAQPADGHSFWMVNGAGNGIVAFKPEINSFRTQQAISDYEIYTNIPLRMNSVGAMASVSINPTKKYNVYFTKDGKQFKYSQINGSSDKVSALYSLY